ncbi:MAG: hypothetical protein ACJAY8_001103, partial [Sphingobacteriales bacterium]
MEIKLMASRFLLLYKQSFINYFGHNHRTINVLWLL